jgi:hypothetical protein
VNCHHAREIASEALDRTLPGSLSAEFQSHIGSCPECSRFYAELRESLALLTELPTLNVEDSFDRGVWAKIEAERPQRRSWMPDFGALRERWAMAGIPLDFGFALRWSPVAVAASLLIVLVLTGPSGLPTGTERADLDAPTPDAPLEMAVAPEEDSPVTPTDVLAEAAQMPEAIEAFLRNSGRELRFESGTEDRLRGSDYIYTIRRVEPDYLRVGSGNLQGSDNSSSMIRPVSDNGAAVIAF